MSDSYCKCNSNNFGGYDCSAGICLLLYYYIVFFIYTLSNFLYAECPEACITGFCDYSTAQDNTTDAVCKCPTNMLGDTCNISMLVHWNIFISMKLIIFSACPNCANGECVLSDDETYAECSCSSDYYGDLCNESMLKNNNQ